MCGIAGYIGREKPDGQRISSTLQLMGNRGPDHQGHLSFQTTTGHVCLLHSRLSIIDLDKRSNQPFTIGHATIVYNGEIYNYIELRDQLQKQGVRFLSGSDTEVLLQYYLHYGQNCVEYLEGMWSFAIYDKRQDTLFLSRDRFAEKPLYLCRTSEGIFFASEIKFIKGLLGRPLTINHSHVYRYLVNGYRALYKTQETYFKEIEEVPFATNVIISNDLQVRQHQYWKPGSVIEKKMSLKDAIEGTRERLLESMRIRLRSDVPLAFCLSGGVDSAALASIAAKIFKYDVATFSIIDDDLRYDESDNIQATIDDLGCQHTLVKLSEQTNLLAKLKTLVAYHDGPVATITYFVHSLLSEQIHGHGYKVAFSGTAADELFTGYYDHFNLHLYEMRHHPDYQQYLKDWQNHTGTYVRNPYLKDPELYLKNPKERRHLYLNNDEFQQFLKVDFKEEFAESEYHHSLLRNRMLNELFHEGTRPILHEDDLNSMMYSVENRSPYLDTRLFDFAYSIPPEYLIKDGYGKYVLRQALDGILNDQVRLDRRKKGFNASIQSIINFDDPKDRAFILGDGPIYDAVKREKIEAILNGKEPLQNSYSKFLFSFINAKIFMENV